MHTKECKCRYNNCSLYIMSTMAYKRLTLLVMIKVWDAQTETQILVRTAAQNLNLFFFTDKSFFFSIGSGDEFRESGDGHSLRWWKFAKIYCQV